MEEGLAFACRSEHGDPATLAAHEAEPLPMVLSTQRAARASLEWYEDIGHGRQRHTRHGRWRPDV
jgi:anthraniloyl-CoA monooxygenase